MSKYPVMWHSESKRADIAIEDLPSGYLHNALHKTERMIDSGVGTEDDVARAVAVRDALKLEIDERDRLAREQAHEDEPPPVEEP